MPNTNRRIVGQDLDIPTTPLVCNEHPLVVGVGRVGIEIELENLLNYRSNRLLHWNIITDESLRNGGREFITKGDGLGGDVLFNASTEIEIALRGYSPDPTWRCSTHIHLDVRDLTVEEMKLVLMAYIFFEKFLFRESGWERYKNNFCVPMGLAQGQVSVLADCFTIQDITTFASIISDNWGKYTALNLKTLPTLGTFEFRMPQPAFRSVDLLKTSNRFLSLKKLAVSWEGDLDGFLAHLVDLDVSDVFDKSLGRSSVFLEEDKAFGFSLVKDLLMLKDLKIKTQRLTRDLHSSLFF